MVLLLDCGKQGLNFRTFSKHVGERTGQSTILNTYFVSGVCSRSNIGVHKLVSGKCISPVVNGSYKDVVHFSYTLRS